METKGVLVLNMTNEMSLICLMFIHKTRHTSAACQDMQDISESSFHIFTINVKLCLHPCCVNTVHFWKCTVGSRITGSGDECTTVEFSEPGEGLVGTGTESIQWNFKSKRCDLRLFWIM